jgi:hypothetical protein
MLLAIALAITTTVAPGTVSRCFVAGSPAEELQKSTAVFSGKVVGRDYVTEETPAGKISQRLVIKIAVERVWKGDIFTDVTMYTSEIHLPNGYTKLFSEDFKFDDDEKYLIYAFGKRNRLSTDECTRTRALAKAENDLKELGAGYEPKIRN